ncbi:MAG: alpha/beta fold hydrolase [Solirubrobacteraceae bacterium]
MIDFERTGARDGEPLVLLHGIGGERCVWEAVLEPLGERFDVYAIDLPGFGRSPALPADVTPTPQALALEVGRFLDAQGLDRAHLAGNSLGGWIALELGKLGRARSVTGLCPAGLWGRPLLPAGSMVRGRAHRVVRRLRPVVPVALLSRRARRLALSPFVADPDKVPYRAAWRMISSYGRSTAYDATSNAMRQSFFEDPSAIDVPVTLAFGEADRLIRPARIDQAGARTVLLPGCGHIPMWDDPGLVVEVIEQTASAAHAARSAA